MSIQFDETIGNWTEAELIRFVRDALTQDPLPPASTGTVDELVVARKFTILDEIQFSGTSQTTVGTAGSASALPATPTGYIRILDNQGAVRVVPYYNP